MNTAKPNVEVDTLVHQQEWPSDFSQTAMDCASSILAIYKAISHCTVSSRPKIIGIAGEVGSGKTVLANALVEVMENALFMDMFALKNEQRTINNYADIPQMLDKCITYIIDETGYCNLQHLADAVKQAIDKECTVILFFQSFQEVPQALLNDLQPFSLSLNEGLKRVKAH